MLDVMFRLKDGCPDRWTMIVNGEVWREVHRTIFGRHPIFPPVEAQDHLQEVFDAFEYRRVKAYILWRLSNQSCHSEQLAKGLQDRLVQSHTIERVIEEYRDMGMLDDESWTEGFIRSQQKRYALRHILNTLHRKGLSSDTIQKIAQKWINPDEELKAIEHLIERRYRSKDLTDYKTRQKVIASLARKGYSFDQIQEVIKQKK